METKLRIAFQKKGRLSEGSLKLLSDCGISLKNANGKLFSSASNFPLEVLFLRDDDIPQYVVDGVTDTGIVGLNVIIESGLPVDNMDSLGFSGCRMSLAIPKSVEYTDVNLFKGKKIATSYPEILKNYLKEKKIEAEIHVISGSVEIATGIGLADAIFDIVSSGSTLVSNSLKEVEIVLKSEAVLVARKGLPDDKMKILNDLLFRIRSVKQAQNNKYILLNAPNDKLDEIIQLLPGMKSPTILPLADKNWSSLHSVVNENDFWNIISKLKELGAQGILVVPIEKMIL